MQKEPTKGFFINSSYRRPGVLKSLVKVLFRHKEGEESDADKYSYRSPGSSAPPKKGMDPGDRNNDMRKAAI